MKQAAVKVSHSALALLLCGVLLLSALSAFTLAWQDFTQHSTNQFKASLYEVGSVVLTKYETGKDGENGAPDVRVTGAEFLLYRINEDATETQVGAQFTTNAEGQLVAHSLPVGNYVFVETAPPYGYDFALDEGGQPITRYPFTIGENEVWHIALKAYNSATPQALTVTKTLQNASGRPLIEDQLATEFVFTVLFSDGGTYDCSIDGSAPVPIASGGSFTLRHGETAVFANIPVGVQYTLNEIPQEDFCTTSENSQGHITKNGAEASFTNTYQDVGGAIFIRKTVGGNVADPADDFVFTVTFEDGGTYYYVIDDGTAQSLTSGGTLTLKGDQTATFGKLPLGLKFTVEETGMPDGYLPTVRTVTGQATQIGSEALFYNIHQDDSDEPGSLAITKMLAGSLADPAQDFQFIVTFSDNASYDYTIDNGPPQTLASGETLTLKGGQTALFASLPKGLGYTVEETPSDYIQSMQKAEGTIVAQQQASLVFTNEKNPDPEHIDPILRVRKQVDGPATDKEFEFTVKIDDEANNIHTVDTFMLKHGETKDFHMFSGAHYEVTEQNYFDDGYIETTTHASGVIIGDETTVVEAVITNTWYPPEMLTLSGTKTWDLSASPGATLPQFITVLLKNGDVVVESKQVYPDSEGNWNYSFEVPKYAPNGDEIHYTLVEEPCAGFWPEVKEEGKLNIINHAYALLAVDFLDVKKSISGKEIPAGDSFDFTLTGPENAPMPEGSVEGVKKITITGQGTGDFGAIHFNHPGSYSYQVREVSGLLAGYIYDGANYNVTIVITDTGGALGVAEVLVTKDGTAMNPQPTETEFINTYVQPPSRLIGISVRKIVIQSPTNPHPSFAKVQLYRSGLPVGDIVLLNDGNNWQHTWQNLDPDSVWTVDEVDVPPGYSKEVSGSAEEGFIVTDRFDPQYEKAVIAGEKIWNHGSNPQENQPTEIVVLVKNGDYVVAQKRVTAAENWQWQFELPKIDSDGKEIHYTIEEQPVEGYKSTVDGWNITNTYTGGGNSQAKNSPQTNDPIKLWLWAGIFAGTAVALASLFLYRRHKRIQKKTRELQKKLIYKRKNRG